MRKPQWVRSPLWTILLLVPAANAQAASAPAPADLPADLVFVDAGWQRSAWLRRQWQGPGSTLLEARMGALEVDAPDVPGARGAPWAEDAGFAQAVLGRIEVELRQGDAFRILGFGRYRRADPLFRDLQQLGGMERFGGSDRSLLESGMRLGAGSLSLELAWDSRESGLSRRGGSARTDKTRAELAFGLEPLRRSLGAPGAIAPLTPASAWLRMASGRSWKWNLDSGRSDPIADISGGVTWSGGSYQAALGVWRSVSGAHAPFGDRARWSATGARLDWQISADVWTLSGAAGACHDASAADEVGQIPESFYGTLSLGLEAFPGSRLSATLGFGDDAAEQALLETNRRFSFDAVVDLAQRRTHARARLRTVYDLGSDDWRRQSHALRTNLEIDF